MNNKITLENYFTTKLINIIEKSLEIKTLHNNSFILNREVSLKLVEEYFNETTDIEQHIVNTFNYHFKNILHPIFEDKIYIGDFIFGISFSILNAITKGDVHSKFLFNRVPDNLYEILKIQENRKLTNTDYNKAKLYLEKFFISKPTKGIVNIESLTMEPKLLDFHKKVYIQALQNSFEKPNIISDFKLNLQINIIKFYEYEFFKKYQEEIKTTQN